MGRKTGVERLSVVTLIDNLKAANADLEAQLTALRERNEALGTGLRWALDLLETLDFPRMCLKRIEKHWLAEYRALLEVK